MAIQVEYTDLFGGELNYCWVKRLTIEEMETPIRKVLKRAREEFGIKGKLHKTHDSGDYLQYKEVGYHRAITILWEC